MRSLLVILVSSVVVGASMAPDTNSAHEALEKINNAYAQHDNLQMSVSYKLYPNWNSSASVDVLEGSVKRKGHNLLVQYTGYEMLETDAVSVQVDHDDKIIVLSKRQAAQQANLDWVSEGISTTLKLASKTEELQGTGETSGFKFTFDWGDQARVDVRYNNSTFFIESVAMYYRRTHYLANPETMPQPRLEIDFGKPDITTAINNNTFAVTMYFQAGNSWQLNKTYSDYELVNLLN